MRLLSIDVPGTKHGGYVLLNTQTSQLETGAIEFDPTKGEARDYLTLAALMNRLAPDVLILERAFLHMIAGNVGACKMWAAEHGVAWWQIGPSSAKKRVLGKGNAQKKEVLIWARNELGQPVSQHISDALLYLRAYQLFQGGSDGH